MNMKQAWGWNFLPWEERMALLIRPNGQCGTQGVSLGNWGCWKIKVGIVSLSSRVKQKPVYCTYLVNHPWIWIRSFSHLLLFEWVYFWIVTLCHIISYYDGNYMLIPSNEEVEKLFQWCHFPFNQKPTLDHRPDIGSSHGNDLLWLMTD